MFSPYDLAAVKAGTKKGWNVQPSAMLDITPHLTPLGICTLSHGNESNGPNGATFDSTTNTLWVWSTGVGYNCVLSAFQVNC